VVFSSGTSQRDTRHFGVIYEEKTLFADNDNSQETKQRYANDDQAPDIGHTSFRERATFVLKIFGLGGKRIVQIVVWFCNIRRKIRAPLTRVGRERILRKVPGQSNDATTFRI
jgi:hypothetical protein